MAYWGHALVLGPNINAPMDPADEPKALELAQKAVALKSKVSPRERAYIDAIAHVTPAGPRTGRRPTAPMPRPCEGRGAGLPDDLDARTLYAEALMDLMPWNYWTRDGKPYPETRSSSVARAGAREARTTRARCTCGSTCGKPTDTPERAEAEADRLLPLMPGAGHIVHMPAHIYQRVGRTPMSSRQHPRGQGRRGLHRAVQGAGLYPLGYYPHNLHFIWMGASASGQGQLALESRGKLANAVPHEALGTVPILQGFLVVPYWAMVRFGKWDAILADKGPAPRHAVHAGAWHYARAMAFTAKSPGRAPTRELAYLRRS
jgi:hypothetical protein